ICHQLHAIFTCSFCLAPSTTGTYTLSLHDALPISFVGDLSVAGLFTIVPRHVLGHGMRAPSDTLSVACIGVGGMGKNDVKGMEGENIYALCDVDLKAAEDSFQAYPKAKRYRDYREMLDKERNSIDAVTISTPDHSHTAAGLLALKAGKHTYIQKPLARPMGE